MVLLFSLLSAASFAQQMRSDSSDTISDSVTSGWSYEATLYYYILPGAENTATLIGYADHDDFHFESRYNYEDTKTVSLFGGYRFEVGDIVLLEATPMIGFAFGNIDGIIPGLEITLTWNNLDFYSESEYVLDLAGSDNNYFYEWSELAITPFDNLRTGISANRTRLIQTGLDLQRGIFGEYMYKQLTAGIHYFNPFTSNGFVLTTLGVTF